MSSNKAQKLARKSALLQQDVLSELDALVKSIARGEAMLATLKADVAAVNLKHQNRRTTREDIAHLEDLLRCTKAKLAWEKQMENIGKRAPLVLAKVTAVMNDPVRPPAEEVGTAVVQSLQTVQAAMARLEAAKQA